MPTELYEEKPKVSYGKRRPRNRRPYLLPRKLKCDPSKEINLDLVDKYITLHEKRVPRYEYLEALYEGFHDVFNAPEKEEWKPDNRLAVNFPRFLTESFVGYGYGNPIKVIVDNEEEQGFINTFEDKNEIDDHNTEMCKYCCCYGHAWEYFYQDEESRTHVKRIKPTNLFVVYEANLKERGFFMVRYGYEDLNETGIKTRYGEVVTREWRREFTGDKWSGEEEPNPYGLLPCVEWILNEERMGLYESIANMNEIYNHTLAEKANDIDAFAEAYMVILGAEVDEDGVHRIRDKRLINFYGTDNARDIVVQFLTKPTADGTQENLLDRLEKLIFLISMVANFGDEAFGNASSGVSMAFKLLDMNNLTKTFNRKIQKSIKKRYKIFCSLSTNVPDSHKDMWERVRLTFNVNLPKNNLEESQIANNLSGVVSRKTQLSVLSIVADPQAEIEAMEEEEKNESEKGQRYLDMYRLSKREVTDGEDETEVEAGDTGLDTGRTG